MKTARWLSICILTCTGVFSMYGGLSLIRDPTGSSLEFPFSLMVRTALIDFSMIGWVLLVTVGLFSITVIICTLIRTKCYSFQMMVQGVIICAYTFIMMLLWWRTFLFEFAFLLAGVLLIVLGAHQYYRKIVVDERKKMQH